MRTDKWGVQIDSKLHLHDRPRVKLCSSVVAQFFLIYYTGFTQLKVWFDGKKCSCFRYNIKNVFNEECCIAWKKAFRNGPDLGGYLTKQNQSILHRYSHADSVTPRGMLLITANENNHTETCRRLTECYSRAKDGLIFSVCERETQLSEQVQWVIYSYTSKYLKRNIFFHFLIFGRCFCEYLTPVTHLLNGTGREKLVASLTGLSRQSNHS